MSNRGQIRYPVVQSILVVAVVILVFSLGFGMSSGWLAARYVLSFSPAPLVIAIACVMVPTAAGAGWFRLKTTRAMLADERLRFAAGVVAANLILLIGGFAAGLALFGETSVLATHSISVGHVLTNYVLGTVATRGGLGTQLLIFAQAYMLGLILTHRRRIGADHPKR